MHTHRYIPFTLPALLLLAACQHEDGVPRDAQPQAVHIEAGIRSLQTRAPQENSDGSSDFSTGDKLQLAVYGANETPYRTTYTIGSTVLYWDEVKAGAGESDTYTFAAWYYNDDTLDLVTNPLFDVIQAQRYDHNDLLLATPAKVSENEPVRLNFHHALHRLVVNVGYTQWPSEGAGEVCVNVVNLKQYAPIDVKTGTVRMGEPEDSKHRFLGEAMYRPDCTFTFFIAPQKLVQGEPWLDITHCFPGEHERYITFYVPLLYSTPELGVDELTELKGGESLEINLLITPDQKIELESTRISSWDVMGYYQEEVEIYY